MYHFGHDCFRFGNVILNSSFSLSLHCCYGKFSKSIDNVKYLLSKTHLNQPQNERVSPESLNGYQPENVNTAPMT